MSHLPVSPYTARPDSGLEQSIAAVREARQLYEVERAQSQSLRETLQTKEGEVASAWGLVQAEQQKSAQLQHRIDSLEQLSSMHSSTIQELEHKGMHADTSHNNLTLENERLKVQLKQHFDERSKLKSLADTRAKELAALSVAKVKQEQQIGRLQAEVSGLRAKSSTVAEEQEKNLRHNDAEKANLRDALQAAKDNHAVMQAKLLSKERELAVVRDGNKSLSEQLNSKEADLMKSSATVSDLRLRLSEGEGARTAKLNETLSTTERRVADLSALLDEKTEQQNVSMAEANERLQDLTERVFELDVENKRLTHEAETLRAENKQISLSSHFVTSKAKLLQEALEKKSTELQQVRNDSIISEDAARNDAMLVEELQHALHNEKEKLRLVEADLEALRQEHQGTSRELVFSRTNADMTSDEKASLKKDVSRLQDRVDSLQKENREQLSKLRESQKELIDIRSQRDVDQHEAREVRSGDCKEIELLKTKIEALQRERDTIKETHDNQMKDTLRRHEEEVLLLREQHRQDEETSRSHQELNTQRYNEELLSMKTELKDVQSFNETLRSKLASTQEQLNEATNRASAADNAARKDQVTAADEIAALQLRVSTLEHEKTLSATEHEKELANERRTMESLKHHHELDLKRAMMERVAQEKQFEHQLATEKQEMQAMKKHELAQQQQTLQAKHEDALGELRRDHDASQEKLRQELADRFEKSQLQQQNEMREIRQASQESSEANTKRVAELTSQLHDAKTELLQKELDVKRLNDEKTNRAVANERNKEALEDELARKIETLERNLDDRSHKLGACALLGAKAVENCEVTARVSLIDGEMSCRNAILCMLSEAAYNETERQSAISREEAEAEAVSNLLTEIDNLRHDVALHQGDAATLRRELDKVNGELHHFQRTESISSRHTILKYIWELYTTTVSTRSSLRNAFQQPHWKLLVERRLIDDDLGNAFCSVVEGIQWLLDTLHTIISELFTDDEKRHVGTSPHFFREESSMSPAPFTTRRSDPNSSPPRRLQSPVRK